MLPVVRSPATSARRGAVFLLLVLLDVVVTSSSSPSPSTLVKFYP